MTSQAYNVRHHTKLEPYYFYCAFHTGTSRVRPRSFEIPTPLVVLGRRLQTVLYDMLRTFMHSTRSIYHRLQ